MNSRGQTALEYLMTYGWVLIVIAIVVGFLVFIVVSPRIDKDEYIKENCQYVGIIKDFTIRQGGFGTTTIIELVLDNGKKIAVSLGRSKLETELTIYNCKNVNGVSDYEAIE